MDVDLSVMALAHTGLESLKTQLQGNQFFAGALGTMLIGGALVKMQALPGRIFAFLAEQIATHLRLRSDTTSRMENIAVFIGETRLNAFSRSFVTSGHRLTVGDGTSWGMFEHRPYCIKRSLEITSTVILETFDLTFFTRDKGVARRFLERARADRIEVSDTTRVVLPNDYDIKRPRRSLDTVFANTGVIEGIIDRFDAFHAGEAWYGQRGIPYKLCLLLDGPPGTGKTSLIQAVAGHYNYAILFARSIHDVRRVINEGCERTLVVIEDMDTISGTVGRSALKKGQPALADPADSRKTHDPFESCDLFEILQTLDGMMTPHALKVMITTNVISHLDPAVLRKGRVDAIIHVGPLALDALKRMYVSFYDDPRAEAHFDIWRTQFGSSYVPRTGAELQDIFLTESAADALKRLIPAIHEVAA